MVQGFSTGALLPLRGHGAFLGGHVQTSVCMALLYHVLLLVEKKARGVLGGSEMGPRTMKG